jgi:hypothetical protein
MTTPDQPGRGTLTDPTRRPPLEPVDLLQRLAGDARQITVHADGATHDTFNLLLAFGSLLHDDFSVRVPAPSLAIRTDYRRLIRIPFLGVVPATGRLGVLAAADAQ